MADMEFLDPHAQLGYLLVRAARGVSQSWLSAVRRHGINPRQFSTLAILARDPSLSQAELARRTMVTPQSMNESLEGLIASGLVARAPVAPGRAARLSVTAEGKALLRKAYPVVKAADEACFTSLSASEREGLARVLGKLLVDAPASRARPSRRLGSKLSPGAGSGRPRRRRRSRTARAAS